MIETLVRTPKGADLVLMTRYGTNDEAMVNSILGDDEYGLRGLPALSGWALDIGAHIGCVGLALARENPDLHVICVEPVPENCDSIRASVAANGLGERVHLVQAAAGRHGETTTVRYAYVPTTVTDEPVDYVRQNRYVGGLWNYGEATELVLDCVSIDDLAERFGVERFVLCKIDCEGCEWSFLLDGGERVDTIVGEHHHGLLSVLEDMLPAHDVTATRSDAEGFGLFRAVLA